MSEGQEPFADVEPTEGGFSIPDLKWRELLFVGALSSESGAYVRDLSRPLPPFRASGLFPAGVRLSALQVGDRVALSREDGQALRPSDGPLPLLHADLRLARRLEAAEAAGAAAAAETLQRLDPSAAATALGVGGGVAAFLGVGSPLTHVMGMGVGGPVAPGDLDDVEAFYRSRGSGTLFELSALADFALFEELGRRGYRIVELASVLAREVGATPPRPPLEGLSVESAEEQGELWTRTLALGFHGASEPAPGLLQPGRVLAALAGPGALLARVAGRVAGGGALAVHHGIACLFADATLPAERGRGVQSALIAHRLVLAGRAGCALAMATTAPGSPSQRNYERAGFRLVYTRIGLAKDSS
jgi:GNAT superfamily N-acetyltransferase